MLLEKPVEGEMRHPDHLSLGPASGRSPVMHHLRIRIEEYLPACTFHSVTQIHVVEKHGEALVEKPHLLEHLPPEHQTGPHGLVHLSRLVKSKVSHPPPAEDPVSWEKPA